MIRLCTQQRAHTLTAELTEIFRPFLLVSLSFSCTLLGTARVGCSASSASSSSPLPLSERERSDSRLRLAVSPSPAPSDTVTAMLGGETKSAIFSASIASPKYVSSSNKTLQLFLCSPTTLRRHTLNSRSNHPRFGSSL